MKSQDTKLIRLQKYIADCGVTSRRKAEELIISGVVKVNGIKQTTLGSKVDPSQDVVEVRGQIIDLLAIDHIYLVLNKPRGYVTTVTDPEGRKTVMDLIPIKTRVYPVGRLDYLSEGLLLLTNDGDFANFIMHPKYEITKVYEVKVFGKVSENILSQLKKGAHIDGQLLRPKSVRVIEQLPGKTWLEFRLEEGKNREIRKICEACGVTIDKLKRVAIGNLSIKGLQPGKWTYITKNELFKAIGINKDGTKRSGAMEYVSIKKSINLKKFSKKQKDAKLANSKDFEKYNKENYFKTIERQKEILKEIQAQQRAEKS